MIDSAVHNDVVSSLSAKLRVCYVFPEVAEQIVSRLKQHLADGEYADLAEGELFALALTLHMQDLNGDEHLWVRFHANPLPEDADTLHQNPEWQAERRLEARLDNYGFQRVERLPGNIGCLEIRYLHRPAWSGDTAHAAMRLLGNTHALILDLRKCTGGYPGMIALLASYFFSEEPVHLSSIYWRDDDRTQQYWTLPHLPAERYGSKPVYVLTSRVTFSAGEVFAAILQSRRRGLVIGDKTEGGAHPGAAYRIHPHFEAFIPIGRVFDPQTGADLEGVGVTPDIVLPQEHAFTAAYHRALRGVLDCLKEAQGGAEQALHTEARAALAELEAGKRICPTCGYPNPEYRDRCKNCSEEQEV